MLELLTSSHDRGWKPTVEPVKIFGPGSSHEMASSIKTLKDSKIDMTLHIQRSHTHTSTANMVNQEQQKAPDMSEGSRRINIQAPGNHHDIDYNLFRNNLYVLSLVHI